MDLIEIPEEKVIQEKVSLKSEPAPKVKVYEVEKKELSKNIQKFERKVKIYKENPYSYNAVSLHKNDLPIPPTQTAEQMITNKIYNTIGKVLGVDTIHDWNKYYDRVYEITEWAKKKSGLQDLDKLIKWISTKSKQVPALGAKRIDDLYIFAHMQMEKI